MTLGPRTTAAIAFIATFGAGAASMRAVDVLSLDARATEAKGWSEAADRLRLTPDQKVRADSVFARYQAPTDAVLIALAPRLAAISDSIQVELDAILNEAQRKELRSMQHPATYVIRRKTIGGSRVDTLRVPR